MDPFAEFTEWFGYCTTLNLPTPEGQAVGFEPQ
jgi:hypothetical protein